MLFGIDMRRFGQQWVAAWNDLLFSPSSPVRRRLDEPVILLREAGPVLYQGGEACDADAPARANADGASAATAEIAAARCVARQLPDECVLTRTLTVPLAAESEMASVLKLEVAASSPFAEADTAFGWRENARGEHGVDIALAIASRTAVMQWLRSQSVASTHDGHASPGDTSIPIDSLHTVNSDDCEVWASSVGGPITLGGFGERKREQLYRKRLVQASALASALALAVLLLVGLFAMQQRLNTERWVRLQETVQQASRDASEQRATLLDANETIAAANSVIAEYPNPHPEIARLTELLADSVFVAHFSMRGRDIRIRGRADDAAVVMQTLAEAPGYAAVTAPQAITAVGNTGLEQFHLDIELAGAEPTAVNAGTSP